MMPMPMVGRAVEIGELTAAWTTLSNGTSPLPRTAIITGEGGCGKSRLVTAALDELHPRPGNVIFGRARLHSPAPYDWLAAVLSGPGRDLSARGPERTGRETAPLERLAVEIPYDALAWLAQHPAIPRQRYAPGALLRLGVRAVRALVGVGPAVIVVEDLHALDPASLNLVSELASAAGMPALMVVTSRPPDEAVGPMGPHLVARTLASLTGTPGALRQHLAPLTLPDVAALMARTGDRLVPAEQVRAVHQRTGGNPYWAVELLASGARTRADALPDHVRRLVLGRLTDANGRAKEIALAAATLGERFHPATLARELARDPTEELRHLTALGLLVDAGSGELRFWPPLVHEALTSMNAKTTEDAGPASDGLAGRDANEAAARGIEELTAREVEVLSCLAAGMSNKQVARSLDISIRTVTVHVSNLLRKTGSASRTEAALWAVQNGITGRAWSPRVPSAGARLNDR